ncbi:benzoyl-CoA 2,3-epoxidase subunit BoxA [Bordetella bronchialis]|uniref:Benzoyl-CoA oxygenase component A n=1 Tax=Bordetella bronchialis TaxID=463025 RepID=A0A193FEZ4_9BORD|nr:benzoyl-CoA 2,3-epoxidase subunit BoxA [Bordetella bronchialis]ANN65766.1 benzoyl-CoA oxygenase/reductase, BoxA protein [Bordetella bronchialis]ANN70796.1 benzoyl-CoA oxygenase/reductase, BoxA protein [Bordetella bronchialis]
MNAPLPPSLLKQHLIDPEICIRCNTCEETCPIDAITHDGNNYVVDPDVCNGCMACVPPCPTGSIDNWRVIPRARAYGVQDQFGWDALPPQEPVEALLAEARAAETTGGNATGAGETDAAGVAEAAAAAASGPAAASGADRGDSAMDPESLAGPAAAPAVIRGAVVPPWSAAHPYVNLYTHKDPVVATVVGNYRVTDDSADSDVRHIVLDFGEMPFPVLEGQSIGILPPGVDARGRPHHARQYSVASPRDGERPGYNNLSLTVKRVAAGRDGNSHDGLCSNYLCDLARHDTVRVIGPFGNTFLMPGRRGANLLMICTGTGSAPMRAMTERCRRRMASGDNGRLMLFFGARTRRELPYFGPLMKLPRDFIDINLALSREPDQPRRYVQDLIVERAADVLALLNDDRTCVYVCGLKGMETGVLDALAHAAVQAGQDWSILHQALCRQGRLHFETY